MVATETNQGACAPPAQGPSAENIALAAMAWILAEDRRAERLLALTGLSPETLRERIADPAFLAGAIDFLAGHEPDLIACAAALGFPPETLLEARATLAS